MIRRLFVMLMAVALVPVLAPPAQAAVHVGETPEGSWRVNGRVYALEIVGDVVVVGGSFSTAINPSGGTAPRNNLAAFRLSDGTLVEGWRADTSNTVRALESDGSSVWVGGQFGRVDGISRPRLAKLDVATGDVDTGFNARIGAGAVRALTLAEDDDLFVGGAFTSVAGVPRNRLARVDRSSGALDPTFDADANANVFGLARAGSRLYASGAFRNIGGAVRNGVAGLDTTTGDVSGPAYENAIRPSLGVDVDPTGSWLFVAGAGNAANNSAQGWNASTGVRLWRHNAMGDIQAIKYFNDTVYFGFHEGFQRDLSVRLLAADPITGALDDAFRPTFNRFLGVLAIDAGPTALVAGGAFTNVNGVPAEGWARWMSENPVPPIDDPPPPVDDPPPPVDDPPPPVDSELVGAATPWRYLDDNTRPAGWSGVGYDDAAWSLGLPQFGYGDGDEQTEVSFGTDPRDRHITTYFRTTFEAPADPTSLELDLLADDGAAVYVNGVELARENLPTGTLTHGTLALRGLCCAAENAFTTLSIPAGSVSAGTNTVAVEVHQNRRQSSDLGFDLRLRASF